MNSRLVILIAVWIASISVAPSLQADDTTHGSSAAAPAAAIRQVLIFTDKVADDAKSFRIEWVKAAPAPSN